MMNLTELLHEKQNIDKLEDIIQQICQEVEPVNQEASKDFAENLDTLVPPQQGLGKLRHMVMQYLSIAGIPAKLMPPVNFIFCSDHGVSAENVSAYPPETTLHMATNYVISKGAAANAFSNFVQGKMKVADLGINGNTDNLPDIDHVKIRPGTRNAAQEPAMTRQEAATSLLYGIQQAMELKEQGYTILLPGEMGISNTTSSAAIAAAICQVSPEKTTGRGTNISDQRLQKKLAVVKQMLATNQPDATDGLDVLTKVGGYELGAIAGLIIGAAHSHCLVILDGFNTAAAALIATTICPQAREYIMASHIGGEAGHPIALQKLGLQPIMKLDIKLGEAIGSSLAADLLINGLAACLNVLKSDVEKFAYIDRVQDIMIQPKSVQLTDKTFDFYTKTMPPLDKEAMNQCQQRLDNLAKPIYCLGNMEKIVLQLSGIIGDALPHVDIPKTMLLMGLDKISTESPLEILQESFNAAGEYDESMQAYNLDEITLAETFARAAGTKLQVGHISLNHSQMDAFEFGRQQGEELALHHAIVGLGLVDSRQEKIQAIAQELITPNNQLRYDVADFLNHLDKQQQLLVSAMLGALVAAAHNSSMVILDDAATQAVARYAVKMLPDLEDFLLPVQPQLYQLDIQAPGLVALAGIRLVTASLHMLNDMKTFAEAQVAVANDGPGKGIQKS